VQRVSVHAAAFIHHERLDTADIAAHKRTGRPACAHTHGWRDALRCVTGRIFPRGYRRRHHAFMRGAAHGRRTGYVRHAVYPPLDTRVLRRIYYYVYYITESKTCKQADMGGGAGGMRGIVRHDLACGYMDGQ
jgi:hypothetical protein